MITVTEKAASELQQLLASKNAPAGSGLRLGVERGGCAGLAYTMRIAEPEEGDEVIDLSGTRFIVAHDSTIAPTPVKVSSPLELEAQFQSISDDELVVLNHELRRSYLTNFERSRTLTYVTGEFRILEVRALTSDDFLTSGAVVKAQALIRPDKITEPIPYPVYLECLFPSQDEATNLFNIGDSLVLKKIPDCAAILNVDRTPYEDSTALLLTVVPLCAVEYTSPDGTAISISPPEKANVAANLPAIP